MTADVGSTEPKPYACPSCGTPAGADATRCTNCGATIEHVGDDPAPKNRAPSG